MFPVVCIAAQQRRSSAVDWQSSRLIGYGNYFIIVQVEMKDSEKTKFCFYFSQKMICLKLHPSFLSIVYDGTGSCLEQMQVCVSDAVCNRYLVPVLQACRAEGCKRDCCQQATQQFYGSMPHNIAEMLAMCDCRDADQSCLYMKTTLQSGTCEEKTWICQETVSLCIKDNRCRYVAYLHD